MTRADREQYRARALEALDQLDERQAEKVVTGQHSVDMLVDYASLLARFRHALAAFPGMTWDEFISLTASRERDGKRGRRKQNLEERASTPIARAARDVDRLNALWAASGALGDPPLPHIELAAKRQDITEDELGERVRRPKSRNPHRLSDGD